MSGRANHERADRLLIGYERCSTTDQDLTAQRQMLCDFGVDKQRFHLDHGLTARNRERAPCSRRSPRSREGDTLVVPKLDGLPRSALTRG
jgi:DNA invertase Pin-like site-specific DNA recombinase